MTTPTDVLHATGCAFCGHTADCDTDGALHCPAFKYCHDCRDLYGLRDHTGKTVVGVHAEYVRRLSESERGFYDGVPAQLPATLPIGTRDRGGGGHDLVRLDASNPSDPRYVCEEGAGCCWSRPDRIDWKSVRRQAPSPSFKVGDWVEWEEPEDAYQRKVGRVSSVDQAGSPIAYSMCGQYSYHGNDGLLIWNPQSGELCEGECYTGSKWGCGTKKQGVLNGPSTESPGCFVLDLGGRDLAIVTKESLRPALPASQPASDATTALPCELCGAPSRGSPFSPLKHRIVDGIAAPACETHWQPADEPFKKAVREKRAASCAVPSGGDSLHRAHGFRIGQTYTDPTTGQTYDLAAYGVKVPAPAENSCMACFAPIPSHHQSCHYCAHRLANKMEPRGQGDVGDVTSSLSIRIARAIEEHRSDFDVTAKTRRDKLGRPVAAWTGWVSTRNAK